MLAFYKRDTDKKPLTYRQVVDRYKKRLKETLPPIDVDAADKDDMDEGADDSDGEEAD